MITVSLAAYGLYANPMLLRFPPRYIAGRHIHHGAVGVAFACIGILLMLDDARDFPWRFEKR